MRVSPYGTKETYKKMASKATEFLTGKIYWAKVFAPVPNYGGDAREWTFEFEPDEAGLAILKGHKLTDRLKDKYEDRGKFLTLRKRELDREGNENKPIRIYDNKDQAWNPDTKIGNGSIVDVKLDIRDYGPGKKKGVYPIAIRVRELVEYQAAEFGSMGKIEAEVDESPLTPKKEAPKPRTDPLDDDMPF